MAHVHFALSLFELVLVFMMLINAQWNFIFFTVMMIKCFTTDVKIIRLFFITWHLLVEFCITFILTYVLYDPTGPLDP